MTPHTPTSIAPSTPQPDDTVYIVLEDFGALGLAYRETDPDHADLESVIDDLIRGEFDCPVKVVAFNLIEGWAKDVSVDISRAICTLAQYADSSLTAGVCGFLDQYSPTDGMTEGGENQIAACRLLDRHAR